MFTPVSLDYPTIRALLRERRLPCAFVDLDAFDHNLDVVLRTIEASSIPLRVASKSLRVVALLERLRERGGDRLQGLMCYSVEEAAFLAGRGFDDLVVAYPAHQRSDIELACDLVAAGTQISLMIDSSAAVSHVGQIASAAGVTLQLVLCVDMSLRLAGGRVHLGVRRSPVHDPGQVVALARHVADCAGSKLLGLRGYEAQGAGLGDNSPFGSWMNPIKTLIRSRSVAELSARRAEMVDELRAAGLSPTIVNGGGSGSLDTTTPATGVTEVTAGSAFLKPHLFDYYKNPHMQLLEPAAFFALEVTRQPTPRMVTCLGGGYVASGQAGPDKVPLPWLPKGLRLVTEEMCGEVQTPLLLPPEVSLQLGDPVVFRHAKGGELAERFSEYLLIRGGEIVDTVPTYRGMGQCFI